MNVDVPGYTPRLDDRGDRGATFNLVSPGYFETLGQQVLLGRDFDDRDGRDAPRVAIVNERFVQHFFAGRNPVGLQFKQQDTSFTIVGVVADVRGHSVRTEPVAMVYLPAPQGPPARLTLLVRTEADPQPLIASLVEAVGGVDRRMPVFSVRTLDEDLSAGLSSERILGYLLTVFAALAILLAGIGLHGLLSYSISRRTREIGIRFAVGAQRRDVVALFAREGAVLVLAGVGVGVTLALVAARALRGLLFGVTPNDPLTLLVSVAVLVGVAILATATSLWRAAHTNLVTALRYD
jgi:predicted permease